MRSHPPDRSVPKRAQTQPTGQKQDTTISHTQSQATPAHPPIQPKVSHPVAIVESMRTKTCFHVPVAVAGVEVIACSSCCEVEWLRANRPIDPDEGMAAIFGDFELVATLPALAAPSPEVLLYRPSGKGQRDRLRSFPAEVWLRATPELWLSHDGDHLLLAPTDPLMFHNLTRGA